MEETAKEVSELTAKLEATKLKGRELATRYQEYHLAILRQFDVEEEPASKPTKPKSGRPPRSLVGRAQSSVTRLLNSIDTKATAKAAALKQATETAERVCRKNGSLLTDEVKAMVEAKISEMYKR
jgi:hypothetical protein